MKIFLSELEKLIKGIPIAYYAGKPYSISACPESEFSFFCPTTEEIVISLKQINMALATVPETCEKESTVRAFVYHELNHGLYTPNDYILDDILNIFEDERIERMTEGVYTNVNFKKNVYNVCGYNSPEEVPLPKTPMEAYFQTVRLGVGEEEALKECDEILKYMSIHSYSFFNFKRIVYDYYKRYFGKLPKENKRKSVYTKTEIFDSKAKKIANLDEHLELLHKFFKKEKIADYYGFDYLFENYSNRGKNRASFASYSGIFNPREVAKKDSWKFFNKPENATGGGGQFSNFHLNLFIDTSGSFESNEKKVNEFLKALNKLKNTYKFFTYNVISCSIGEKILPEKLAFIKCNGGNNLTNEIYKIFRKLQKPLCNVFNIVLFDGGAYTNSRLKYSDIIRKPTFLAFDTQNTVIISNPDNECFLKKLKKARIIISKNYTQELEKEMLYAMKLALS